jgi:hypothetical protein
MLPIKSIVAHLGSRLLTFLCATKCLLKLLGLSPFPFLKLPSRWDDLALDAPPFLPRPHAQHSGSVILHDTDLARVLLCHAPLEPEHH